MRTALATLKIRPPINLVGCRRNKFNQDWAEAEGPKEMPATKGKASINFKKSLLSITNLPGNGQRLSGNGFKNNNSTFYIFYPTFMRLSRIILLLGFIR
jgi:hypothetical protein